MQRLLQIASRLTTRPGALNHPPYLHRGISLYGLPRVFGCHSFSSQPCVSAESPEEVSKLVWQWSREPLQQRNAHSKHKDEIFLAIRNIIRRKSSPFTSSQLVQLLYGLHKLGWYNPKDTASLASVAAKLLSEESGEIRALCAKHGWKQKPRYKNPREWNLWRMSNLIHALQDDQVALAKVVSPMVERLLLEEPTPSLHELGNFLASCSKVRIGSQTVKAWVWRALEHLPKVESTEDLSRLSTMIVALLNLKWYRSSTMGLIQEFSRHFSARLEQLPANVSDSELLAFCRAPSHVLAALTNNGLFQMSVTANSIVAHLLQVEAIIEKHDSHIAPSTRKELHSLRLLWLLAVGKSFSRYQLHEGFKFGKLEGTWSHGVGNLPNAQHPELWAAALGECRPGVSTPTPADSPAQHPDNFLVFGFALRNKVLQHLLNDPETWHFRDLANVASAFGRMGLEDPIALSAVLRAFTRSWPKMQKSRIQVNGWLNFLHGLSTMGLRSSPNEGFVALARFYDFEAPQEDGDAPTKQSDAQLGVMSWEKKPSRFGTLRAMPCMTAPGEGLGNAPAAFILDRTSAVSALATALSCILNTLYSQFGPNTLPPDLDASGESGATTLPEALPLTVKSTWTGNTMGTFNAKTLGRLAAALDRMHVHEPRVLFALGKAIAQFPAIADEVDRPHFFRLVKLFGTVAEQSPALRALCRETLNHLYQSTGLQPRAYSEEEWEKLEGYYMRAKPAEFLEYRIVWEK